MTKQTSLDIIAITELNRVRSKYGSDEGCRRRLITSQTLVTLTIFTYIIAIKNTTIKIHFDNYFISPC
jgi:hypothetical protein